jgi:hypothetical protein
MQAFKPAHPSCIYAPPLPANRIFEFFKSKKTLFMDDHEVDAVFDTVMKGF